MKTIAKICVSYHTKVFVELQVPFFSTRRQKRRQSSKHRKVTENVNIYYFYYVGYAFLILIYDVSLKNYEPS